MARSGRRPRLHCSLMMAHPARHHDEARKLQARVVQGSGAEHSGPDSIGRREKRGAGHPVSRLGPSFCQKEDAMLRDPWIAFNETVCLRPLGLVGGGGFFCLAERANLKLN
jgi:hypothetical protein